MVEVARGNVCFVKNRLFYRWWWYLMLAYCRLFACAGAQHWQIREGELPEIPNTTWSLFVLRSFECIQKHSDHFISNVCSSQAPENQIKIIYFFQPTEKIAVRAQFYLNSRTFIIETKLKPFVASFRRFQFIQFIKANGALERTSFFVSFRWRTAGADRLSAL